MNSSFNSNDLVSYPNQPFCFRPFSFESNQSSKLQHSNSNSNSNSNYTLPPPPSSLSFFQLDNSENSNIFLHHDLLHHHHQSLPEITDLLPPVPPSIPPPMDRQVLPRRRSSKRDRHSKISTARGLRDRRMRLSLEVAKRFFGLQDMLGFDKASKTVEWLLNQAKVEIKQIARAKSLGGAGGSGGGGVKSASSTSECEGVSSLEEVVVSEINQEKEREKPLHVRRRASKVCRKSALNSIGKESRERARERARERTRQKLRTRRLATESNLMNRLSCNWINPFETVEESATHTQSANHPSLLVEIKEQASCHANKEHLGTVEEDMLHQDTSFVIMSTMMLNSLSNSSNSILHEHQFAEFQSLGKPCWEAYI